MVFYQLTALFRTERKRNLCFSLIKSIFNTLRGKTAKILSDLVYPQKLGWYFI